MTEEGKNIEIIKGMFAAFDKGDIKTLLNGVSDEKIDWRAPVTNATADPLPWAKPRQSRQEVESFFREYLEKIQPLEMKPLRFTAKDDRVIVEGTERSKVISTGSEYLIDWVMLFTLKNGKVTLFHNYFDTAEVYRAMRGEVRKAA